MQSSNNWYGVSVPGYRSVLPSEKKLSSIGKIKSPGVLGLFRNIKDSVHQIHENQMSDRLSRMDIIKPKGIFGLFGRLKDIQEKSDSQEAAKALDEKKPAPINPELAKTLDGARSENTGVAPVPVGGSDLERIMLEKSQALQASLPGGSLIKMVLPLAIVFVVFKLFIKKS